MMKIETLQLTPQFNHESVLEIRDWGCNKSYRILIKDIYLVYIYKDKILNKKGSICREDGIFIPDDNKKYRYHTGCPNNPNEVYKGKIWVLNKEDINFAIKELIKYHDDMNKQYAKYKRNIKINPG